MTVINLEEGATIVDLAQKVLDMSELGIDLKPIPEILKYCPVQYAEYEKQTEKTIISFSLRFILAEDEEGDITKELTISVTFEHKVNPETKTYTVQLGIPLSEELKLICDATFKDRTNTDILVLSSSISKAVPLNLLEGALPSLEGLIPDELEFGTNQNVLFVFTQPDSTSTNPNNQRKFIIGLGINGNLDLSQLPLVASQLPPEQITPNFTLELLVALQNFEPKELKAINKLLLELATPLKINPPSSSGNKLYKGVGVAIYFSLLGYERSWFTRLKRSTGSGSINPSSSSTIQVGNFQLLSSGVSTSTPDDSVVTVADNGAWLSVQKSFGPIHFEKIGLVYKRGEIHIVPEIVLEVSKFSLSLVGVSISSPLLSATDWLSNSS
ncbi:hypothetical protein I8748_25830 [Nostoc sp. CENA67]|uniref:Uncharacterized protein n=1 Tax=Amazonocrinis nigriterrae CENA67 TaxID=2794033 RepID=A0A8J7HU25_9NOST|nr:hypothetical protein [Amazonocrinis nigriterrae]MBH8565552.1 hypothetical protein [Amazonocrinis nigriterrae CENA67]